MASVRGLLNIQSLNDVHAREIPIQRTVSHMVLWSRVCVSARDSAASVSARCGPYFYLGGRARRWRAVCGLLNIQSLNESSTHEKGLTRGTRYAVCAVCCGPVRTGARPVFRLGPRRKPELSSAKKTKRAAHWITIPALSLSSHISRELRARPPLFPPRVEFIIPAPIPCGSRPVAT